MEIDKKIIKKLIESLEDLKKFLKDEDVINKDTSIVEKHPYAKTDYKKSHLNARNYYKLNYVQLLGNINWLKSQDWSEGVSNDFEWNIDRDQNWYYKNKKLIGSAKIQSGILYLVIKDYNQTIIELEAKARKFK